MGTVTVLHPRETVGPRWPKTPRRQTVLTVDGVPCVRWGPGWQVEGSLIGFERLDGARWTVVCAHLDTDHEDYTFTVTSKLAVIRELRRRGLLPATPEPEGAA